MKKLYCVLFLLPVVCYASPPTKKTKKNLEQQINALQQQFEDIDKKMNALIEKINAQDLLLAKQVCDTAPAVTTCDTDQSDGLQTIIEEPGFIETTQEAIDDVPVKKLKLSWGKRIAPKKK